MPRPLPEVTRRLAAAYRSGSRLALLFDYDGTLTPIVEHPALALLDGGTRGLLRRLAALPGVTVGVFSGRSLADLRQLVALPGLCYAGAGGLELDLPRARVTHPGAEASRGLLGEIEGRLARVVRDYPGAWVEDRRFGLTLHYRQVAPDRLAVLWERAEAVLRGYAARACVVAGPMAWEVTPALGWGRGSALRLLMRRVVGAPAVPVYAGDCANDAEALEAAAALGGYGVAVGEGAPEVAAARHRLRDPAELADFLAGLAEALASARATASAAAGPLPGATLADPRAVAGG